MMTTDEYDFREVALVNLISVCSHLHKEYKWPEAFTSAMNTLVALAAEYLEDGTGEAA